MTKNDLSNGLMTLFAAAAIGGLIADAGGFFNMQRTEITVSQMNHTEERIRNWPSIETADGRVFSVQGGGMYSTPDGLTWDDTTSLLGKMDQGKTYCAVTGEPVFMRKHKDGNLIGIYAPGPCPQPV